MCDIITFRITDILWGESYSQGCIQQGTVANTNDNYLKL